MMWLNILTQLLFNTLIMLLMLIVAPHLGRKATPIRALAEAIQGRRIYLQFRRRLHLLPRADGHRGVWHQRPQQPHHAGHDRLVPDIVAAQRHPAKQYFQSVIVFGHCRTRVARSSAWSFQRRRFSPPMESFPRLEYPTLELDSTPNPRRCKSNAAEKWPPIPA